MRIWLTIFVVSIFAATAIAQTPPTPGIIIDTVIHEPSEAQIGSYIVATFPDRIGEGKGYDNGLERISPELYAIGGTTTHDLVIITNRSGGSITIDTSVLPTVAPRPSNAEPGIPQQPLPDTTATLDFIPVDPTSVTIPNGTSAEVWLVVTKWAKQLDTFPRDYILNIEFDAGSVMAVEADLIVPEPDGNEDSGGCAVSSDGEMPTGLWLIAAGVLGAYIYRRQRLKKMRA